MLFWEPVLNKLLESEISLVYIGIGSGMGYYKELTNKNNQQYPCFLEKFTGEKVIILIDPHLEYPLKIESKLSDLNILEMISYPEVDEYSKNEFNETGKPPFIMRHLRESSKKLNIFALNYSLYYENSDEINIERRKSDMEKIISIVEICLRKIKKIKLIVQDYTGRNINDVYIKLFKYFDKMDLLNNILFDVSQGEGGCYIELNEKMASTDIMGNFNQEKYSKLKVIKESLNYEKQLKYRIDNLIYPLSWEYLKLKSEPYKISLNKNELVKWFLIYDINWDNLIIEPEYLIIKLEELINSLLDDIIESKSYDKEIKNYLLKNINKREEFISTLSILKINL